MFSTLLTTVLLCIIIALVGTFVLYLVNRAKVDPNFTPSSEYQHYRSQTRSVRRYLGWPSGRQWTRHYKYGPLSGLIRGLRAEHHASV